MKKETYFSLRLHSGQPAERYVVNIDSILRSMNDKFLNVVKDDEILQRAIIVITSNLEKFHHKISYARKLGCAFQKRQAKQSDKDTALDKNIAHAQEVFKKNILGYAEFELNMQIEFLKTRCNSESKRDSENLLIQKLRVYLDAVEEKLANIIHEFDSQEDYPEDQESENWISEIIFFESNPAFFDLVCALGENGKLDVKKIQRAMLDPNQRLQLLDDLGDGLADEIKQRYLDWVTSEAEISELLHTHTPPEMNDLVRTVEDYRGSSLPRNGGFFAQPAAPSRVDEKVDEQPRPPV